ncbi:hypothetical protein DFJ58DRAFT_432695 [Suillus subalutaceus]|uniref:uncharacterized protein n=1 Tax=Suillus subalutaceus TaxID=48586 RepID=UPI001B8813A3|nr:uncharacterized protein DFJ58DRAFT_432695 [Suillus subalutaceus]KAG1850592.1 hypothetical protein DFJ58DRAFT_432695 [Suillus subalutaceus]
MATRLLSFLIYICSGPLSSAQSRCSQELLLVALHHSIMRTASGSFLGSATSIWVNNQAIRFSWPPTRRDRHSNWTGALRVFF